VRIRASTRARRLALRVEPRAGVVDLVMPAGASQTAADRFLSAHAEWVAARIGELPPRIGFTPGAVLPILGRDCTIRHVTSLAIEVVREGDELLVGGPLDEIGEKVAVWLRTLARRVLTERAEGFARILGRRPTRLTIRDPRSRWGSCSSAGRLSFSWRLVLAPPMVLDYVAAHEVAHLRKPDHGPRFWALVERLCPGYHDGRVWLRRHGARLHRYG